MGQFSIGSWPSTGGTRGLDAIVCKGARAGMYTWRRLLPCCGTFARQGELNAMPGPQSRYRLTGHLCPDGLCRTITQTLLITGQLPRERRSAHRPLSLSYAIF